MRQQNIFIFWIFSSIVSLCSADMVLIPTEMRGLRNGSLLSFSAVKNGTADRTIAHYNISALGGIIPQAIFDIPVSVWDPGPPLGTFEVYAFYGDGIVSSDEWNKGTLVHTFTGIDDTSGVPPNLGLPNTPTILSFDVTSILQTAVNIDVSFLSFNFRAGTGTDRYFLGSIVGLPNPTITIIPEPCTLLLLGVGGLLIRKQ